MSIITRFVERCWNVSIYHDKTNVLGLDAVRIKVSNGNKTLVASGETLADARKVLCLMNQAELSINEQV